MSSIGSSTQNATAHSGYYYANEVGASLTMPSNGWITNAHAVMGGYTSNPYTQLCIWSSGGSLLWSSTGFNAGTGPSQHDQSVSALRLSSGTNFVFGFWRDPAADAQWSVDTTKWGNWNASSVGTTPTTFAGEINGSGRAFGLDGALDAWVDYVANATPNAGAWQSPSPTGTITDTDPQFSGTLPQNPADSSYESVGSIEWQFTRTDTGALVSDITWSVNSNASSWTLRPSALGIALQAGVPYSAQFRYTDSWGVWSPWSSGRTFTISSGPTAPTSVAPSGRQNAITGLTFSAVYHAASLSSSNVQFQVLDGGGRNILWDSGTVATVVTPGSTYSVAQWFSGLQWGARYNVWTRAQDSGGTWGPWSALTAVTTDTAPNAPVPQSPSAGAVINTGSVVLSAVFSDPDGDNLASVTWDLFDTTAGQEVTGYPLTVTGPFGSGSTQSKDVTSALTAGHAYQWSASASDGTLTGASSTTRTFIYTNPVTVSVTSPTANQVLTDAVATIAISYGGSAAKASDRTVITDTTSGAVVYDSGNVSGNRTSWTLPYGVLTSGHHYSVKVTATDANGLSATSSAVAFSASWTSTTAPRLKLLINGVDRTANMNQTQWFISQNWGRQGDTATVYLTDEFATTPNFTVPPLATVELRDLNMGIILFSGLATRPRRTVESPNLVTWMLSCTASGTAYLNARVLSYDYSNWTADAIVRDLIAQSSCGVTANHVMPGPVIPRFRGQNVPISRALQHLCKVASTTATYGWWVDGAMDLHFGSDYQTMAQPSGITFTDNITGPATLTTGHYATDSQTYYEWDATTLKTRVMVQGANITRQYTEQFLGDGTRRSFRLTYPYQTNPEYAAVVVNGTQVPSSSQAGAKTPWVLIQGASGVWSLSVQPGAAPPASGTTIQITYNYSVPVISVVQSPLGISAASGAPNGGYWDSVVVDNSITDLATAQARGQREVREYGVALERTVFKTSEAWSGWVNVGQSIKFQSRGVPDQFNNWAPGINDDFLVTDVRATGAPGGYRYLTITAVRI